MMSRFSVWKDCHNLKSKYRPWAQISAIASFVPRSDPCWGVPSPNPAALPSGSFFLCPESAFNESIHSLQQSPPDKASIRHLCRTRKISLRPGRRIFIFSQAKKYNTPHRSHVIKTRLSDEEYEEFLERCRIYDIPQAEMIRSALTKLQIYPIIKATTVSDQYLSALNDLLIESKRIGNNLNQIAHALNAGYHPDESTISDIQSAIGGLASWRQAVLKEVGDQIGNDQAYRL